MLCGFFLYSLFHIKFCIPFIAILQTRMNWILFISFLCIKSGIKRRLSKLFSQLIWNHDVTNSFSLLYPTPAPALFCMYFPSVIEENPQNLRCTCSFESTNSISIISFMFCNTSEFHLKAMKMCLATLQCNEAWNWYCVFCSVVHWLYWDICFNFNLQWMNNVWSVLYYLRYLKCYNLACLEFSKTDLCSRKIHGKKTKQKFFFMHF